MKFEVVWHPAAVQQLLDLHWRAAANVDADVIKFAEARLGTVDRRSSDYLLHSGVYRVRFSLLRESPIMHVLGVYRAR